MVAPGASAGGGGWRGAGGHHGIGTGLPGAWRGPDQQPLPWPRTCSQVLFTLREDPVEPLPTGPPWRTGRARALPLGRLPAAPAPSPKGASPAPPAPYCSCSSLCGPRLGCAPQEAGYGTLLQGPALHLGKGQRVSQKAGGPNWWGFWAPAHSGPYKDEPEPERGRSCRSERLSKNVS